MIPVLNDINPLQCFKYQMTGKTKVKTVIIQLATLAAKLTRAQFNSLWFDLAFVSMIVILLFLTDIRGGFFLLIWYN